MMKRLLQKSKTGRKLLFLFGVIIITMSAIQTSAQVVIDFNGTFPPAGPPVVSNPTSPGTVGPPFVDAPAVLRWLRGDSSVVNDVGNGGINPGRGGSGFAASFNSYDIRSGNKADLIINDVNLSSGYTPYAVLKFWMINTEGTDVIRVFARNGNDPWVQIGQPTYGVYSTWSEIPINLQAFTGGSNTSVDFRIEATSDYGASNIGIDDISIASATPMIYASSTTTQRLNDREIFRPLPNQEIIRLVVNTSGSLSPVAPDAFFFNTAGSTNTANISNAKLWSTGTTNTFDPKTAVRVGNIVASPNGVFSITGITQAMAEGQNFYFLTFDVTSGAVSNDTVDARFDSIRVANVTYIPTVTNPAGRRIIRPATVFAQTPGSTATGSALGRGPSTGHLFNRSISIYTPAEMPDLRAGQTISSIGFELGALAATPLLVSGTIKIYLQNTSDASFLKSTTFATAIVGMRKAYDGTLTINPEAGTYDIRLDTPFVYTGGNIYVGYDWNITNQTTLTAASNSGTYACTNNIVGGGNGNRSATGTTAPTTLGSSAFRPKVRFGVVALPNDVSITHVYTLTQMANPAANPHVVRAIIRNNGFNSINNYNVNLSVSGANTYSNNKQVSLAFGETALVAFDPYSNTTNGVNTVKVRVASDPNTSNDSIQVTQNVTATQFSYAENMSTTGSLGFGTGAGMMLTRYRANGAWLVDSVRISMANNAASVGKRVLAVVLNSEGTIIARSDTVLLAAGDLNRFRNFRIVSPRTVSNEDFFVGLSQIANATAYSPLGTQIESPTRTGAFYTAASNGTSIGESNTFGRFPIDAYVSPAGPAPTVNIGPDRTFCQGDSVTLDAGNPGLTYLWSTGATTQTIKVKTSGTYVVTVRNAQGNPARDTAVVTVNQFVPASVSIVQSPAGIVCSGLPVTFTATPTNGGTAPTYAWLRNGTVIPNETGATLTISTLSNNDVVAAVMTSNLLCKTGSPDTSNAITMQVSAGAAAVTVTAAPTTAGPYCAGSSISFTATPSNGGAAPKYKWYVNNVLSANDTTANFTAAGLNDNDTVKVELISNSLCILGSSTATFKYRATISPNLPVSVTITADKDSICGGQSITFTANPTNGGTSPSYKWYRNGVLLSGQTSATLVTSLLVNSDTVKCELTSSEICQSGGPAMSNNYIAKVSPLPNSNFTNSNNNRTVTFTNTSTNATTYAWTFGDGATSTSASPTHTYSADGSFNVRLITTNACGNDTITKGVTIATVDANVTGITAPVSGCNLSATAQVRIRVRNNRAVALTNIPVSYQINGGTVVNDVIPTIGASGLTIYTFTTTADLSNDGAYNVTGWASLPNDFDNSNDTFKVAVFNQSAPDAVFSTQVVGGDLSTVNATDEGLAATTYAWNFGDGFTSADKNPTHTYAAAGTYEVSLIAVNACGSDSMKSSVTITAVGINNTVNAKNVMVYPNPNNGKFNVNFQLDSRDNVTVKIVNLNGQTVYSNNIGNTSAENLSIDLSELAAGVYTLKVEGVNTQITKKISVLK